MKERSSEVKKQRGIERVIKREIKKEVGERERVYNALYSKVLRSLLLCSRGIYIIKFPGSSNSYHNHSALCKSQQQNKNHHVIINKDFYTIHRGVMQCNVPP